MTDDRHSPRPDSKTVLVVDDERELADLFALWLSDSYAVRTAYSGEEAIEALDEDVDVMLLDRRMPGLSGDDVLRHIRAEGFDVRVVIVSAATPDFDVVDMGFDEYLVKPVGREDLQDVVERMLARTSYSTNTTEYARLITTKATLEAEKSRAALERSDRYRELTERIAALDAEADELTTEFDRHDYEVLFRDLETNASVGDSNQLR